MSELKHAGEPEPEEEQVDDGDHDTRELVLARAEHHRREESRRRAVQPEAALDPIREGGRILVDVARGHEYDRHHREEEIRAEEHGIQLPVGRLVAAHPAHRGSLT